MLLRNAIEQINGLRYMVDSLELRSGLSKRILMEMPFMMQVDDVGAELDLVGKTVDYQGENTYKDVISQVVMKLDQIKDLRGTIGRIEAGLTLGDIEFFEVKVFAMNTLYIRKLIVESGMEIIDVPDVSAVVSLLDPDMTLIPHFSIYDTYSLELTNVRKKIKKLKQKGGQDKEFEQLYIENAALEDKVREKLSAALQPFGGVLVQAMNAVARLDILIAKSSQAIEAGLCKPSVYGGKTQYLGLFNPMLRKHLMGKGKDFQAIDIALFDGPTVITGANMGGKTVLLKTVALAQALCQFGFYVPAAAAEIVVCDEILLSIGDEQDEMSGLSSFAAEMVRLDAIMKRIKEGDKALVLIDEPARTTNPVEGEAIVNALLDFLERHRVRSLVTSHYGGIDNRFRRLKVRGLDKELPEGDVTVMNIQEYMDYSLTEDNGDVPREALRIARMLGVDEGLLVTAGEYLKNK